MTNSRFMTLIGRSVAATVVAAACGIANAADEPLQEIVVTGSNIPTTPDAVAVPVITLSADQLANTGNTSNALEMLRKAVPAFEGRSNAGDSNANNNNQNTAGGSQVQLRNLPTLVLVNGRRVANSGIGAVNGKNFVDVNQIPISAIDHVEVLTDGASAIYGSDAVGGVVNFILKSDYEGFTAGVRDGSASDYGERSAFATGGMKVGNVSLVANLSYTHTDPLSQSERSFSDPFLGHASATSLPGVVAGGADVLSPSLPSPSAKNPTGINATAGSLAALVANGTYLPTSTSALSNAFNLAPYQTLLLKQDVPSFSLTLTAPLQDSSHLEAYGDFIISQSRSFTRWAPVSLAGITVPAGAPSNPLTTAFTGVDFTDLNVPHDFYNRDLSTRLTAGLRGEITQDWTWDTAVVYSESDLTQRQTGLLYKPNLPLAIAGGYNSAGVATPGGAFSEVLGGYSLTGPAVLQPALDPFATAAGLNPASLNNLYGTEVINAFSKLVSWDGSIVGRVLHLPGGQVGLAAGVNFRRESLSGETDPDGRATDPVTGSYFGNDQQWVGGTFANPFTKSRTIIAQYGEVRVPVTSPTWSLPALHALDLIAAFRNEHYSDAGNSTVPKIGLRWQPLDAQLTIRGNFARSFIAPALYSEYGPTDTRTSNGPIATAFGANYGGEPFNAEDGNNPNLQPATATSKTVGFVFKPTRIENLTLSVDWSSVVLDGFQGGAGFNNILSSVNSLGSASPFFGSLGVGAFPDQGGKDPFTTPGSLLAFLTNANGKGNPNQAAELYLVDYFRNLAQLTEKSWNVSASYNFATDRDGTFAFTTNGAIFDSFLFNPGIAGLPSVQGAGTANNASVFGGTLPKYRFYSTFDWIFHGVDYGVGNTFATSVEDTGGSGILPPIHVAGYLTWDLRASYTWHSAALKDLKVGLGINNVTNRMPPWDPRTFTDNNVDVSTYSPIGRLLYGTVSIAL